MSDDQSRPLRRYGQWAGDPAGTCEDQTKCIEEVFSGSRFASYVGRQCQHRRGYGPDGLYCVMHAKQRITNRGIKPMYDESKRRGR